MASTTMAATTMATTTMATTTMASTTMASTTANKATSLEASPSLPQTRISLSTLLKRRAAVSSSVNTSAPLELSTVLAQSHPQQSVLCWPASLRSTYQDLNKYSLIKSSSRFQAAIAISGRTLFSTIEGDLGYGPVSSLPGDEVWVLENGRVPFILRPTRNNFSFSLIGECYVHGIMDGQLSARAPIEVIPLSLI
ncbi:hypothetical protein V8E51_002451 [Hyaloscypha variabilis]